tara:strand:+ start:453 stop:614 length:162 start_codon:yes stop_codon:yes gene_type:complete
MGLNFNDEFTSSAAGLSAPAIDVDELDLSKYNPPALEQAREENQRLFKLLYDN